MIRKQYASKTEVDTDERTVTATITTSAVDRDGEVVLPSGINLDNYLKNPVVLWAHNSSETPIGKALWLKANTKRIAAKVQFPPVGVSQKADEVYELFKLGFLNAFSIGFIPTKSERPTSEEVRSRPAWAEASRIFHESELLEFSAVPVPANPQALATEVKSKGIKLSDELIEELGLDDEDTVHIPDVKPEEKTVEEVEEPEEKTVQLYVRTEPVIKTYPAVRTRPVNRLEVCRDELIECIKARVTGKE